MLIGLIITVIARIFSLVMPSYVNKSIALIEDFTKGTVLEPELRELALQYILIILGTAILSVFLLF